MKATYVVIIASAMMLGTLVAEAQQGKGSGDRSRARDGSCLQADQARSCSGDRQKDQGRTRARDGSCQEE